MTAPAEEPMTALAEDAPAKINLCLFLGPLRPDGRHELVSVMESITLADRLSLEPLPPGAEADEVVCPAVPGENLAAAALRAFRAATGWDGGPVRLTIDKRIPVAAGLGGGSADAAAALRLAARASGRGDERLLLGLAARLGADVAGQVRPRRVLATGMGEVLHDVDPPSEPYGVLVLPSAEALSTGAVYAEADRLGVRPTLDGVDPHALVNDLEPAARSLCPAVDEALAAARAAGADHAMDSGSGPTVVGLFPAPAAARAAAGALAGRVPAPIACEPLTTSQ